MLAFTVSEFVVVPTPKLEQYFMNGSGIFFFENPAVRWSCPKVGNTCGINLTAIVLVALPVQLGFAEMKYSLCHYSLLENPTSRK
jgi:hypothetical protein